VSDHKSFILFSLSTSSYSPLTNAFGPQAVNAIKPTAQRVKTSFFIRLSSLHGTILRPLPKRFHPFFYCLLKASSYTQPFPARKKTSAEMRTEKCLISRFHPRRPL